MKISELTAEQGLEAVANSLEYIGNIAEDETALELCNNLVPKEGDKNIHVFARAVKVVPKLLKTHKDDVFGVLAAFNLQTSEDYKDTHKLLDIVRDVITLFKDKEVRQLFFSAPTGATGESSGDA